MLPDPLSTVPLKGPRPTRYSPPRPPRAAVERAQLLARVEESAAPLTLICAPPGFGKTTFMQQLRARLLTCGVTTVWLQVDGADNELGRFLQSLIGAVQVALPEFESPGFAHITDGAMGAPQSIAADILDRIALSDRTVALFLDDLELITDASTCSFLQRLLPNLGPHHRVVIGSRTTPNLVFGKMRAHGLLLELGETDLRFSQAETRTFLERQDMAEPEVLQSLEQRTQGWPVALQLAAIALSAKEKRGADWLHRFSGGTGSVAEYLAQEVLESRPVEQRNFLLRSSVVGEFCADMCDAVLDRKNSAGTIEQILRSNLLLSSVEVEQGWYRYHPLFADFLRAQLQQEAPDEVPRLHRDAALWSARHGLADKAVAHALAARDHGLAADLLASCAMGMVRSGRVADAARAIAMLPEAEVMCRPALLRAAAFAAIFSHRYSAAMRYIDALAQASDTGSERADDEILSMRLMLQGWTDRISGMLETVARIRAETTPLSPFIAGLASNASAYGNMALGRYLDAQHDLAQARQACEPIHALYVLNYSTSFAAAIELSFGNAASARTTLDGAMNRAIAEGQRYGSAGAVVAAYLAEVLYETNQLDACEALVNDYLSIVVETGLPDHLITLHRIAARLHFQQDRWDAAQATLSALNELGVRRGIRRLSAAAWLERSYLALRHHDLDDAHRSLTLGSDPAVWQAFGGLQPYASEIENPMIAGTRLQLVQGKGDQALARIQTALREAEALGRRRLALRLGFLQAQLLESVGRHGEAKSLFDATVERASLCGLVRTLVDDNWVTKPIITRGPGSSDPSRAALLRELTPASDAVAPARQSNPTGAPAFHLTTREIQVLRLLWKGHSNKAIARDLFLSENTVETHLRRIYEKLGTRNRTQAAALAHEAGAI